MYVILSLSLLSQIRIRLSMYAHSHPLFLDIEAIIQQQQKKQRDFYET